MKASDLKEKYTLQEGWKDLWGNFKDAARRSVGASVGDNRGILYQFTGEFVQNAINDLNAAIKGGLVDSNKVDSQPDSQNLKPATPPTSEPSKPSTVGANAAKA